MKNMTIGLWACTISLLALPLVAAGPVEGAARHKSDSEGSQAGRSHGESKAAPKDQDKAQSQPDMGTGVPAQPNSTPSNKTQMVEERLRRGDMDEANAQGQISDRLDQFYQGSEGLPGRRAAGQPDR